MIIKLKTDRDVEYDLLQVDQSSRNLIFMLVNNSRFSQVAVDLDGVSSFLVDRETDVGEKTTETYDGFTQLVSLTMYPDAYIAVLERGGD